MEIKGKKAVPAYFPFQSHHSYASYHWNPFLFHWLCCTRFL